MAGDEWAPDGSFGWYFPGLPPTSRQNPGFFQLVWSSSYLGWQRVPSDDLFVAVPDEICLTITKV